MEPDSASELIGFSDVISILLSADESARIYEGKEPRKFKAGAWPSDHFVYSGPDGVINDDDTITTAMLLKREGEFIFPWSPSQFEFFTLWQEVVDQNPEESESA